MKARAAAMTGEVRLVRCIRASRQDLWEACSTTAGLQGWYADRVSGSVVRGGTVKIEWPDLGAGVDLDVTELVSGEHIVFVNGDSRVRLEVGEGVVTLAHEGLASEDDIDGFESSWRVALATLAHAMEAHPGAARRTRWACRPVRASATLVHTCFTEPAALDAWFGPGATMGSEGERFALQLGSGDHRVSGRVLVRSEGRDVALSWEEQSDSLLSLRTLPSPKSEDERIVAACWSKWGPTEAGERALENELRRALERLGAMLAMSGKS